MTRFDKAKAEAEGVACGVNNYDSYALHLATELLHALESRRLWKDCVTTPGASTTWDGIKECINKAEAHDGE